jgi:hypothetical protein
MKQFLRWILAVCSVCLTMAAYPPGKATVSLNPPTVVAGAPVDVTACGFAPGELVIVSVDGVPGGSAIAGADGCASITLVAPATPGSHDLAASGQTSGRSPAATLVTLASASPSPLPTSTVAGRQGNLPITGQSVNTTIRMAIALIIVGLGAVSLTAQRRRQAQRPPRRR